MQNRIPRRTARRLRMTIATAAAAGIAVLAATFVTPAAVASPTQPLSLDAQVRADRGVTPQQRAAVLGEKHACVARSEHASFSLHPAGSKATLRASVHGAIYWHWCFNRDATREWVRLDRFRGTYDRHGHSESCRRLDMVRGVAFRLNAWNNASGRSSRSRWHTAPCERDTTGMVTWSLRAWPRYFFVDVSNGTPRWEIEVCEKVRVRSDPRAEVRDDFHQVPVS